MNEFDGRNLAESLLRWIHVVAGIAWIGHLYFFNWVNANFAPTMDAETKKKVIPQLMPRALFWFRWGAAFTWVTGLLLLGLVYYMVGANMFNPNNPPALSEELKANAAWDTSKPWGGLQLLMLAVTFLSPFIYEAALKFLKSNVAMFWGGLVLVAAVLFGYRVAGFSDRAYQIHLGGLFGTIMAFNVWFRIWPAQKQIISAIRDGQKPDDATVATAGARSRHNTFLSVPLVFLMLNAHNTWVTSWAEQFPVLTLVMVFVGWGLTQHLYGISKKVKGM